MNIIPFVTYFFLAVAGMYIGYFIWYRDNSDEEAMREALSRENEDLRASLKLAHNSHEKLDERFLRQKGQLNVLQQLCDDWSSSRENAERDRANLEAEVSDKSRRLEETLSELQAEKQKRISLEDQTHQLNQLQIEKLSELEKDWRQRHGKIESSLFQRQADLKSTSNEKTRLAKQLHSAEARIAELQSELASQRSLLETATRNASGLEQEYVTVESALQENSDLLKQSRSECASALSAQKVAEESLCELEKGYAALQCEMEETQAKLSEMESLQPEVVSLRESLANSSDQLDKVTEQRNKALATEKSIMARAKGLQQRIENQEATIHSLREKHDSALEGLKAELQCRSEVESRLEAEHQRVSEMEARLESELQRRSAIESNLEAELRRRSEMESKLQEVSILSESRIKETSALLSNEFGQTRSKLESQLADQTQTIVDLNNEIKSKTKAIEKLTDELETLDEAHAATVEELRMKSEAIQKLNDHRAKLESALSKSNEELGTKTDALQQLSSHRTRLEETLGKARYDLKMKDSELDDAKSQTSQLMSKVEDLKTTSLRISELQTLLNEREQQDEQVVNELRTLREQYAEAYQRQQDLQVQLSEATSLRESMESEFGQHGTDVRLLKMKLKASEETIRKLRRERAGVLARLANYRTIAEPDATVISFTEALAIRERQMTNYDAEYGGRTSRHEKRGVVYTEAPKTKDDLKRISGIAEVLEGRLNDYGIYTFRQIMDWEPAAVEEFSRLLAFRDRIERDDWRSQAKYFYNEKKSAKQAVA